jgi:hypothetical protein
MLRQLFTSFAEGYKIYDLTTVVIHLAAKFSKNVSFWIVFQNSGPLMNGAPSNRLHNGNVTSRGLGNLHLLYEDGCSHFQRICSTQFLTVRHGGKWSKQELLCVTNILFLSTFEPIYSINIFLKGLFQGRYGYNCNLIRSMKNALRFENNNWEEV